MNYFFKLSAIFTLLFVIPGIISKAGNPSLSFDKSVLYAAMASTDIVEINSVLASVKESTIPEKTAYEGALLMRKAGLSGKAKEKMGFFKSGRTKLEAAIKNDEANVEYRFLRLIIQENAPKITRYKSDLKEDAELIRTMFKKLPHVVQQAAKDYSKNSTILNVTDL